MTSISYAYLGILPSVDSTHVIPVKRSSLDPRHRRLTGAKYAAKMSQSGQCEARHAVNHPERQKRERYQAVVANSLPRKLWGGIHREGN